VKVANKRPKQGRAVKVTSKSSKQAKGRKPSRKRAPVGVEHEEIEALKLDDGDVQKPTVRVLLEAAMAAHGRALKSRAHGDTDVALVLDAVWLAERRRERGENDPGLVLLKELGRVAWKYLATRQDQDRWGSKLPPRRGPERTDAVRALLRRVADGKALFLHLGAKKDASAKLAPESTAAPGEKPTDPLVVNASVFASGLLAKAHELGLWADRKDRKDRKDWLARQLYEKPDAPDHMIATWVLRATGHKATDAKNWVSSALG